MELTDKEKLAVELAFKNVLEFSHSYSCVEVEEFGGRELVSKYTDFFEQKFGDVWPGLAIENGFGKIKKMRLMMLATFWELEGKI